MKTFKILIRIMMIVSLLSISAFAVTLDIDDFNTSNTEGWSGGGGVVSDKYKISSPDTASKTFSFPAYANQAVTLTLTADSSGYDDDETYIITINGRQVANQKADATLTFNGTLNASGQMLVTIKSNANNSSEYVTIDNVSLNTGFTYTANNPRDFSIIYQNSVKGDMKIIGNSILCEKDATTGQCAVAVQTDKNNNDLDTLFYKLPSDSTDVNITNSTSYTFALPTDVNKSDVLWAGLYWQAGIKGTATDANMTAAKSVKLKAPGDSAYRNITAETANNRFNWMLNTTLNDAMYYQGVKDITSIVQSAGAGTYQVANITATSGTAYSPGHFGGWSIVLVYKDTTATLKNLTVYDGFDAVNSANPVTTTLSGFLTPLSGTVNSKFLIFGSEGDVDYDKDKISITQNSSSGTAYYLKSDGTASTTSGDYNPMNSSIIATGSDTRMPSYGNVIGIDIDTYNVGTGTGALGIITNNQTSTKITLSTGNDVFNPGVFAFSTDLYEPDVCYVENIFKGTTNISGIGAQVNKDDNLTVRVYIKNKGTDSASGVSVLHQFDSSFPYAVNSTNYNNSNPASEIVMPPITYARTTATDSAGNDLYEYNTTSLLAKINLGTGATSSSGGTFAPNTTSAVFEYNATVKIVDSNYSNVYKAGYINSVLGIDYTNNPVTIFSCDGSKNSFYGYSAPAGVQGNFNVVYNSNWPNALGNYYYNLPTAIASRADNYKVIALNTGTDTLKDVNVTAAVELVDVDSSANCSSRTALSNRVWVKFNNQNATNFTGDTIAQYYDSTKTASTSSKDEEFYQKAGKNVAFRINANTDTSNNLIELTTLNSGQYKLTNFPTFAQGQECGANFVIPNGNSNQITTWCANNGQGTGNNGMTQSELFTCMECIFGINTQKVCSKDNFAIRPEAFYVKLSDQNQTNFVTKQVMSNNISGAVSLNLASGYKYFAEVNATNHVDNNATSGYTTTEGLDSIWTPGTTVVTGCNDDTNKSSILNFSNGLVEANLSVDQVGKYNLNITDDTWANVDSNVSVMSGYRSPTPASLFLSGTDCTLNSAVSSALGTYNGCNISSNHVNSDAGITYVDTGVEYRPYDFNLTSIQMSRGQNFAGTIMGQNTWTYMNSVNVDENMSVRYFGPIKAEGKNGTLMSNYVNNCYAQPINMDLNLTFPAIALPNWSYRLQEVNATTVWRDTNGTFALPTSNALFPLLTIPQTSFLKNQNGLADMNLSLNFDRNQTVTVNPITVGMQNFQVKCQVAGNCSTRADFSTAHLPDNNLTTNNNTTFMYGRIIPRDVRVFGSVPFSANGWYEVFNVSSMGTTNFPASKNDAFWYTNTLHNDVNDGDANVTAVVTATSTTLPVTSTSNATGIESYLFSAETPPYGARAHMATDPWLWYGGTNALGYLDPVDPTNLDCLTHPCFNISVVPAVGATGSAKSGAESKKASKKSTSESGAGGWKSTSDYAPAIR